MICICVNIKLSLLPVTMLLRTVSEREIHSEYFLVFFLSDFLAYTLLCTFLYQL